MKYKKNDFEKMCVYCENATIINDDSRVLCIKRGIVPATYKCRKYSYDPLKRVPPRPLTLPPIEYIDIDSTDETN